MAVLTETRKRRCEVDNNKKVQIDLIRNINSSQILQAPETAAAHSEQGVV